ncbi:histidine phosphatase family protein [uncultured Corynebacterium sp.]|uniref:histidine phosphatase family protein n=1 Tax=uncultured Corynebacterium sp. TaxID=159447 RepID=UPI00259AF860|nr:histidine phosphatase family protein [uncultured Corynebacterium sp.]
MARRLILLRHGQTTYNATSRMQGQLDTELSEEGRQQARNIAPVLTEMGVAKIVASDLSRAAVTAQIVAEHLELPVMYDARLRETHLGQWQGKTHAEVDGADGSVRAHWRNTPTWAPPEGESRIDVAQRARPVVDELMEHFDEWDDAAVLLVAHGGTIAALTSSLLDLEISQYPMMKSLRNANFAQLQALPRYGEPDTGVQWYLEAWNQGLTV